MAWALLWRTWSGETPLADVTQAWWRDFATLYAWFLGLQMLDAVSTGMVLALGGLEANPAAAPFARGGLGGLLLLKLALVVLTAAIWIPAARRLQGTGGWAPGTFLALVAGAGAYYAAVVFWNLANLAVLLAPRA